MKTYAWFGAAAVAGSMILSAAPVSAQSGLNDMILRGRMNGAELSPAAIEWARSRPAAFEFKRALKGRLEHIRARRAAALPSVSIDGVIGMSEMNSAGAVLDGTFSVPVILGLYSDTTAPYAASQLQDRLFGTAAGQISLTTLYDDMSNGVFEFTGTVVEWATLPRDRAFYEDTLEVADLPEYGNIEQFLRHSLAAVDPGIDFGLYDNDGPDGVPDSGDDDGYVDTAAFMYPGIGQECNFEGATGIWAHRFRVSGWGGASYATDDPSAAGGVIRVDDYIVQGGLNCAGEMQDIGVVAHESGHALGLPDFYDRDDDADAGQGNGHWALMAAGNWNRSNSPAHMMAFSKMLLGWVNVVTLENEESGVVLQPVQASNTVYRINLPGVEREYFLLENRQATGSDQHLAAEGMLIWHIDSVTYEGSINDNALHKAVDLEEADGLNDLDRSFDNGGNRGDANDPFPGGLNRTRFAVDTSPNSNSYAGSPTGIAIDNIQMIGGDITFDIGFGASFAYGDVNVDDVIDPADLALLLSNASGEAGPDYSEIERGDVDADGDVDLRDAYIVHAFLEGRDVAAFRVAEAGVDVD